MRKSPQKKNNARDLEFQWVNETAPAYKGIHLKGKGEKLSCFDEYLDFLEEIGPLPPDPTPPKIFKERFTL
jgi:hypothetical protein